MTEIVRSIGASSYELDFTFDSHGRMTQITYPLNVDSQRLGVEYLYDSSSVLSQVRNATTTSLVYYTLNEQDGSGAVRRATLGNGLVEQYGYEAATGRLASIKTGPGGSATLQNLEFEWDLAGNLEERVDQLLSRTEIFDYDALDRLTSVVRNSSSIFSAGYDALGNLTSKTGVSGTYTYGGSRPHAVTAIGSQTFAYDGNGNMTDRNGTDVDWTSYNLPSRIERPSGEYSEFLYGADRSRYRQVEGAGAFQSTRHYASPGLFEVLTWASGASRVDYHYIHANGRAVAQFTTSNVEADELQYLHRDHQGSVVATTDTSGAILDRFEYDAFGQRTTTVGSNERMHRGYTGHEQLEALDLIHMNGRVQDPVLGRFLSPDPFVWEPYRSQSLNRYSYVWNNPLSLIDPSGFKDCRMGKWEECALEEIQAMECQQDETKCAPGFTGGVTVTGRLTGEGESYFSDRSTIEAYRQNPSGDDGRGTSVMGQEGGGNSSVGNEGQARVYAEIHYNRADLGRQIGEPRVRETEEDRVRYGRIPITPNPQEHRRRGALLLAIVEGLAKDIANDFHRLKYTDKVRITETRTTRDAYHLQVVNTYAEPRTHIGTEEYCCEILRVIDVSRSEQMIYVDPNGTYVPIESVPDRFR